MLLLTLRDEKERHAVAGEKSCSLMKLLLLFPGMVLTHKILYVWVCLQKSSKIFDHLDKKIYIKASVNKEIAYLSAI